MTTDYGAFLCTRRDILGMSQRELAQRSGVKQPYIAAIERGRRAASTATKAALDSAVALRPSDALAARRDAVRSLFESASLGVPSVFGSVAQGSDTETSDLDLLVEFTDQHDIVDLLELEEALRRLLTVPVDIIDARQLDSRFVNELTVPL